MALIKCPECGHKISDQCESCPKCGYELNKKEESIKKITNITKNNNNLKYLIIIGVIIVGILLYTSNKKDINQNTNQNTNQDTNQTPNSNTPQNNNGMLSYTSKNLGVFFTYPSSYKVTEQDGAIYVGQNIDNKGALIPYIIIAKYNNYNNPVQFLNKFTDALREEYGNVQITIDLVSGNIGGKSVYGIAYNYYSSNHLVVDNRYAFVINNKVYMVGTKEENQNSEAINNVVSNIISSLTEGGN